MPEPIAKGGSFIHVVSERLLRPAQLLICFVLGMPSFTFMVYIFTVFVACDGVEQIFVADNNGAEQSCLSSLRFFGSPVATTKMGDFKKVEE